MDRLLVELGLALGNWPLWAMVLVVWLGMAGMLARGVGFHRFFRDDKQILLKAGVIRSSSAAPEGERLSYGELLQISPAFWSHFAAVLLIAVVWLASHSGLATPCPGPRCAMSVWPEGDAGRLAAVGQLINVLAGGLVLMLAASFVELRRPLISIDPTAQEPKRLDWQSVLGELGRGALGGIGGIAVAVAAHYLAWRLGSAWGLAPTHPWAGVIGTPLFWLAVIAVIPLGIVTLQPKFLACLSVISLFIGLSLIYGLIKQVDGPAIPVATGLALLWLGVSNAAAFKNRIPGFATDGYAPKNLVNPDVPGKLPGHPAPLDPVEALKAWHRRVTKDDPGVKPKLVLLATSGGAYRAAFWTALILDRLAECDRQGQLRGLAGNIRLITGASGGMVAGAYFTALAARGAVDEGVVARIEADTVDYQRSAAGGHRRTPIRRDSLTPVLQQMVRRDLPALFSPLAPAQDRGRVLDRQWQELDVTFAEIRRSEAEGIAPSIMLSPMLVESGAPAFFANLDLGGIRSDGRTAIARGDARAENQESVEVFAAFPQAYLHDETGQAVADPAGLDAEPHRAARRGITLATAVRLNATFPYISPAVSLPTAPSKRRLVDAGYYDNYGIDMATAYLNAEGVREWITRHCSGVAVLQIRAFPEERPVKAPGQFARALHFLSSPPEALFSARQASQMFRNNQQLRLTKRKYPEGFVESFTFEASVEASMSWYLADDELTGMRALIDRMATEPPRIGQTDVEMAEGLQAGKARAEAELSNRKKLHVAREFERLMDFWHRR